MVIWIVPIKYLLSMKCKDSAYLSQSSIQIEYLQYIVQCCLCYTTKHILVFTPVINSFSLFTPKYIQKCIWLNHWYCWILLNKTIFQQLYKLKIFYYSFVNECKYLNNFIFTGKKVCYYLLFWFSTLANT